MMSNDVHAAGLLNRALNRALNHHAIEAGDRPEITEEPETVATRS